MTANDRRHELAAALAQAIYALAVSVREPKGYDSADARARASLMLVDAFDLAGERSWDAPSDAERHPANRPIPGPGRPSQHPAEHVAAVRQALADARQEPTA